MLISLTEYAKRVNRDTSTLRQRILRGALPAVKIGRNWLIEENTPLVDNRFKTEEKENSDGTRD